MTNMISVSVNYINQRIDNFLFRELGNVPKSLIYRLIRKGAIRVNGKRIKPDYKLLLNDQIKLPKLENITDDKARAANKNKVITSDLIKKLTSRIIFENNDLLIINKPSGMAVHAGSKVNYGIIDILRKHYGPKFYLELAHRLDRDTSGCLLIAKNRLALHDLHNKLKESEITKTYLALVKGTWSNSNRLIKHSLRKSVLQGGERMVVVDKDSGKSATTKVEVKEVRNNTSLLQLNPVTGRTHQLRVHCAHEQHPIIGDIKYGDKTLNQEIKQQTRLKRVFLHAYSLEFIWGSAKNVISVTAPIDQDLEKTLEYFGYL